jgi:hypothetical protein
MRKHKYTDRGVRKMLVRYGIQEQQRLEEAKQRAEWPKLNEQQRAERQAAYLKVQAEEEKLRAERKKIDLQRAMDRDVISKAVSCNTRPHLLRNSRNLKETKRTDEVLR